MYQLGSVFVRLSLVFRPSHVIAKTLLLLSTVFCLGSGLLGQMAVTYNPSIVFSVGSPAGAALHVPAGVATDGIGDVFIADSNNNRIVKVTRTGVASVVDIGTPNNLSLNSPQGLAVDGADNLYIADYVNNRVLRVTLAGVVSTLNIGTPGGTPLLHPVAVAVDTAGNVYIADNSNSRILKLTSAGASSVVNVGTPGGIALLAPYGVALDDAGDLFIADTGNRRIVEVTPTGVSSVVNLGSPAGTAVNGPFSVLVDATGDIFFSDYGNHRVVEKTSDGSVSIVNIGSPEGTGLRYPYGLTLDSTGNLYIADSGNDRIVEYSPSSVNLGDTRVGSSGNPVTLRYTVSGYTGSSYTPVFATTYGRDFTLGSVSCTGGSSPETCSVPITLHPSAPGSVKDSLQVQPSGGGAPLAQTFIYGTGDSPLAVFEPGVGSVVNIDLPNPVVIITAVTVDLSGNTYAADVNANRVIKVTPSGASSVLNVGSPAGRALNYPNGLAADGAGNLYISDHNNQRIVKFAADGTASVVNAGNPGGTTLGFTAGVAADGAGNLFVVDSQVNVSDRILEISQAGVVAVLPINGLGQCLTATSACGIATDVTGDVYVTDPPNNRVVVVSPTGATSVLNTGDLTLNAPNGVAVDAGGNVYITDSGNNRLLKVTPTGTATELNIGTLNHRGLSNLSGVALDSAGNISIADSGNLRVVQISRTQSPLSFASTNVGSTSSDSPQTISIANIGNRPLTFASLDTTTTGQTRTSFSIDRSSAACSIASPLAAGGNCPLPVSFVPTAAGQLSGTVHITSNNLNMASPSSIQQVSVSGTGLGVAAIISFSGVPTGNMAYGSPVSITATLTGSNGIPSGAITYTVDGGSQANAFLSSGGVAQFVLPTTLAPGTHSILVNYSGDANYTIPSTAQGFTLTVTAAASQTMLSASANNVTAGQAVALTATTTSATGGIPAGAVTFYNGSASIGTGMLNAAGVATFAVTLPLGTNTITAQYGATTNYTSSTSPLQTITVVVAPVPSYSIGASSSSLSISQGQTGAATLQLLSTGGYTGTLSFSCQNLPANATCTFTPSMVQASGNNQAVSVNLSVATNVQQAQMRNSPLNIDKSHASSLPVVAFLWPGSIAALLILRSRRESSSLGRISLCLMLLLTTTCMIGISGCSSGSSGSSNHVTPVGTSTVTVVATQITGNGPATQSTILNLTIAQ